MIVDAGTVNIRLQKEIGGVLILTKGFQLNKEIKIKNVNINNK